MVRRAETDPIDRDEQLGEAIEAYLAEAEAGTPPDPEHFAARYPELREDLCAALEGLALVQGLVGGSGHRLESGRRIAGYRIVRELGRGGMGTVYEAVHVDLDRPVALKVLGTNAAPDSTGRRRFLNEARTAAGLHHTHIVPVFDVGQVGGLCYYAMQRIEGSGLDHVLRHLRRDRSTAAGSSTGGSATPPSSRLLGRSPKPAPLLKLGLDDDTATWFGNRDGGSRVAREPDDGPPPFDPPRGGAYFRWVAEVGREAAEALSHAHTRGIIHRDIKPSNLLVDARGIVWVADFGLARRLADPGLTQHDGLLGTPRYMSPEQARIGPIDGRSDVYSLGATLYELLTLRPPFDGQTAAELIDQIGSREAPGLRLIDPRIPRDLETIILKALAKRPADRYATATELAEDLERFLRMEPVRARRIGPLGRLWRFARRHPGMSVVSTAAAVTVTVVATLCYVRVVEERDEALQARAETQTAMQLTQAANREAQAAIRTQLWRQASLVRLSNVPNRRVTGLGLIKDATARGPEPALRAKLRDEAIAFLVLRDVEARPDFATGPTRSITFGPQGSRLAALSENGAVFSLWDVAPRRKLDQFQLVGEGPDPSSLLALPPARGGRGSAWGQTGLAMLGQGIAVVFPDGQGIRLFDAATGAPIREWRLPGRRIFSLVAASGGHRLVTVEVSRPADAPTPVGAQGPASRGEYRVQLYDPEHMDTPLATLGRWDVSSTGRDFPQLAISPDGQTVALARLRETTVSLFSGDAGKPLGPIETQAELTALALGSDGVLATAGAGTVRLWDIDTRTQMPGLSPFQSFVRLLRFNPQGTLLAVAGVGADVELWDPAAHSVVAVLPMSDRPEDLTFSPDGLTLAAAGAGATTSVWAVVEPAARTQLSGFDAAPTSLAFRDDIRSFRDDALLAMGSFQGTVRFWRPGRNPCSNQSVISPDSPSVPTAERAFGDKPTTLAFDDKGHLVAVDPDSLRYCDHHPSRGKRMLMSRTALPEVRGGWWKMYAGSIARASGGRTMFVALGPQVLVWNSAAPDKPIPLQLPDLPEHPDLERRRSDGHVWRSLATSPSGDRLYLIDHSGDAHALAVDGTKTSRLDWSLPLNATCLATSPDGRTLAVGDRQGTVWLVDTSRGTIRSELRPPDGETEGRTWAVAFSPDGQDLAVGTQLGHVEIWSLANTSGPRFRLPGHRGFVTTLAYDPKSRYLASGGSDKLVDIWNLDRIRDELGKLGLGW